MLNSNWIETCSVKLETNAEISQKLKSEYSQSTRAINEQQRHSIMTEKELTVQQIYNWDRQVIHQIKKKTEQAVNNLEEKERKKFVEDKIQSLSNLWQTRGISSKYSHMFFSQKTDLIKLQRLSSLYERSDRMLRLSSRKSLIVYTMMFWMSARRLLLSMTSTKMNR